MRTNKALITATTLAAMMAAPLAADAQGTDDKVADYVPEEDIIPTSNTKKQGLDGTFGVAANFNLNSNRRVVGQVDGNSFLFGLSLIGGLDYVKDAHEVRNTLSINQSWARTPVIPEFVKSNDLLDLESVYNYFLLSWLGPFARLNLETQMLETEDVRAQPQTYSVARNDGTTQIVQNTERFTLADPFQPFTLNQSVGLFAEPYDSRPISVDIRVGLGARQTFADGVIVLTDNDDTPNIEAMELANVYQGGLEIFSGLDGKLFEKRVVYDVGASVLFPFLNNDPEDRSVTDLTKIGVSATVGFNVVEWMIVQYQARLMRDPQLIDALQVQNNVLLTFQYTFIERNEQAVSMVEAEKEEARAKEKEEAVAREKTMEEENEELRKKIEALEKALEAGATEDDGEEAPDAEEGGEEDPGDGGDADADGGDADADADAGGDDEDAP